MEEKTTHGNSVASGTVIPHWYAAGSEIPTITDGEGARVTDDTGTEYLDFVSQLYCVNAGHSEQRITDAMTAQAERIQYVAPSKHNDTRSELAGRLADIAAPLTDAFFAVSGSEANESAIQLARAYTGRHKVLTRWRSYHGGTYGAGSLTGDPETRVPIERYAATSGVEKFLPPMEYRSPFDGDTPEEIAEQAADHLEFVIRNEGPDSIAAILTEPIGGTSGAYTAPPGYFQRVRELCDEYGILLISDEVITGFGRCGEWFGIETEDVVPDMITFAKGATSAYAPLAGVMTRSEIGDWVREQGLPLGQTFGGHPVACAASLGALDAYEDGLLDNVRDLAPTLQSELEALADEHDAVGDVHGRGFLWGVEFTDPETGEPFFDPRTNEGTNPVETVREHAQEDGVLLGSGRPNIQLIVAPPFCITEADIAEAVSALDTAIASVFES